MLVPFERHRVGQELKYQAFFFGMADFLGAGGQFLSRAAVNEGHGLGPQPQSGSRRVHGHVAPPDHADRFSANDRRVVLGKAVGFHQVASGKILVGRVDPAQVFARHAQEYRQSCSNAQENGIDPPVQQKFLDGDRLANHLVQVQLHTQAEQIVDFLFHDLLGEPELRDAVHQHSARFMEGLENRHRVPQQDQVSGDGQAGRA